MLDNYAFLTSAIRWNDVVFYADRKGQFLGGVSSIHQNHPQLSDSVAPAHRANARSCVQELKKSRYCVAGRWDRIRG
jgi:hypothetical protein